MSNVAEWNEKLAAMKANINGRLVQNDELHKKLEKEMENIFLHKLTPEEQKTVERPRRPLLQSERSLIAHNNKGELIGFDDDEEFF